MLGMEDSVYCKLVIFGNSKFCRYASRSTLYDHVSRTHTYVKLQLLLSRGIPECIIIHFSLIKSLSISYNKSKIAGKNADISV